MDNKLKELFKLQRAQARWQVLQFATGSVAFALGVILAWIIYKQIGA